MLRRWWFLLALLIVVPTGWIFPEGGAAVRESRNAVPILVAATLFVSGFTLNVQHLVVQLRNLRAIVFCVVTTYAVAPALAFLLAALWGPDPGGGSSDTARFTEALMIAAAQASTLASAIALTVVARGDQELALVITVASNALTAVFTPLVLELWIGARVEFPFAAMVLRMALVVLAPVLAGQAARRLLGDASASVVPAVRIVPQLIILVFVATGVSAAAEELSSKPALALRFLGACASLHLLLLGWSSGGGRLLRLAHAQRTAVTLCGSQKTLPNGMYVWDRFFPTNPYGALPLVLYHLFQLVVDTVLVGWLRPDYRRFRS